MTILFTNNATTTLASGITNTATSLTVASGTGALFPSPSGSDVFYATLANSSGSFEIVQVTARSTDTFTIVRAQDGSSAFAWNTGDKVELRLPAVVLNSFATQQGFQQNKYAVANAGGTSDALTASYTPAITALTNGMSLLVRAAYANTTTTPTFTPNSGTITAATLYKGNGLALSVGDIAGAGHWIELQYDSTLSGWVLLNPATGVTGGAGATGAGGDQVFFQNGQTVNNSYTITSGKNAGTFGPVTVATGVTVTVPTGTVWTIV